MAGYPTTKDVINSRVGGIVVNLRNTFDEVARLKVWLDGQPDADLIARGFTETEVAEMKSAFTALDNLRKVATGAQAQSQADDFFYWARRLTGVQ